MDGRHLRAALLGFAALAMGAFLLAPVVRADDAGSPARAVRLGFVEGEVQISQGGQVLADPAVANAPLFEGTQVTTLEDGQAEIQFEDGSVARLSPSSSISLSVLRQQNGASETEIVVQSGLAYFELQAGDASQMRVRFGQSVATASGFTVLRIGLDNPPGDVAVFSGNAHIDRGNAPALDLHGGESVAFQTDTATGYDLAESIEPDSWDAWNQDRDQALQAEYAAKTSATKGFADSNNPAWADLDTSGNWYDVPDQGYVWSPNDAAAPGWDPYGNGHWMWTPRFGYIWVSGDPWGYLPFQCGTWNYFDAFGWGWSPGLGMCRPWWGRGYGWRMNIGFAPGGYRYPLRPIPRRPIQNPRQGTGRLASHPLIAVNHRPPSGSGGFPVRGRNTPVVIGGHTVQPLRPLPQRQQYDRAGNGSFNRSQSVYQGARTPATQGRPNGSSTGGSHPGYSPAPRPSGGSGSHAPPPSHSSGGYSGGGGSHVSSGGGSAGGGGGSRSGGGGSSGGGSHH